MNSKKFSILFAVVTIILQMLGIYFLYILYRSMHLKGILLGIPLYFFSCIFLFYLLSKIQITNNNKPVKIWDIFGDIIALTVSLVVSSVAILVVSMVVLHNFGDVKIWAGIPLGTLAIVYGALGVTAELKKNA